MAVIYCDFDTANGNDSDDGSTWALAKLTLQAAMTSAGDNGTVYVRRTNAGTPGTDTAASARTLTGTSKGSPVSIKGCKDGTTAAPPASSDYAVRGTDTQPLFTLSGAGNDITFASDANVVGMHFIGVDRVIINSEWKKWSFVGCHLAFAGLLYNTTGTYEFIDCNLEYTSSNASLLANKFLRIRGGVSTFTVDPSTYVNYNYTAARADIIGHDYSGMANKTLVGTSDNSTQNRVRFLNCPLPATLTLVSGTSNNPDHEIEFINCTSTTSVAATDTIRDYYYQDAYGIVELEETVVRTGGADDQTDSGLFSYIMTPTVGITFEGTENALKSPWLRVWVAGGANTLKVYTVHDDDGGGAGAITRDLYEDELWCEFYTPDAGDTALHDQTFDPTNERLFDSTTATGTDDTTSTWATYNTYKRYFTVALTQGYSGWAYARVHYAKAFSANQVAVYVDPKIEVT